MSCRKTWNKGVSLVEVLTASAIALLIFVVITAAMRVGQSTHRQTDGLAGLSGEMLSVSKVLRDDLKSTALTSIVVYDSIPSVSMASVGASEKTNRFAAGNWKTHIFYVLKESERNNSRGISQLIRWVNPDARPSLYPLPSKVIPWNISGEARKKVVARNVLSKGWAVSGKSGDFKLRSEQGAPGGFVPQFIRQSTAGEREYSLHNPGKFSDRDEFGWSSGSTSLFSVKLHLVEAGARTVNSLELELKVQPRNG